MIASWPVRGAAQRQPDGTTALAAVAASVTVATLLGVALERALAPTLVLVATGCLMALPVAVLAHPGAPLVVLWWTRARARARNGRS